MPVEGTKTHIAASYITEQTVCANNLCQKIVSENTAYTPDSGAAPDYHTFAGGVCTVCGYACPHADIDTYERMNPTMTPRPIRPSIAWMHTYTEYGTLQTVCADCGATVSEKEETRTVTGSHVYIDGVCDLCGAENTCPHDLTKVEYWYWGEETYEQIDENTHKMAYDVEGNILCLRCGVYVGTTPIQHIEEVEEHSFDTDGVCRCGAAIEVVECDHTNLVETWDPEDDEMVECTGTDIYNHTGTIRRYIYPKCADCGESFYEDGHWEEISGTFEHYFDFGLTLPETGCMVLRLCARGGRGRIRLQP